MDLVAAQHIGAGLAAMGMIGAGAGLGILFGNYLQGAIRNPTAAGPERIWLFLGMALTESMGIFALVVALLLKYT